MMSKQIRTEEGVIKSNFEKLIPSPHSSTHSILTTATYLPTYRITSHHTYHTIHVLFIPHQPQSRTIHPSTAINISQHHNWHSFIHSAINQQSSSFIIMINFPPYSFICQKHILLIHHHTFWLGRERLSRSWEEQT